MAQDRRSIVVQCAIISALVSTLLSLFMSYCAYSYFKSRYENDLLSNTQQTITKVNSFLLGYFYNQKNWIHLQEHIDYLNAAPNTLYNYILNNSGDIEIGIEGLAQDKSAFQGKSRMSWEPELPLSDKTQLFDTKITAQLAALYPEKAAEGDRISLITTPISCQNSVSICGYLRVAISYLSIQKTLNRFRFALFLGSLVFSFLIFFVVFYTARKKLRGIRLLSQNLHDFAANTTLAPEKIKIQTSSNDPEEEYYLKESIQAMLATKLRLEKSQQNLADLQSEADLCFQLAHDLRSPIAALDALSISTTELPSAQKELLKSITTRMRGITKDLANKAKQKQLELERANSQATHLISALVQVMEEIRADQDILDSLKISLEGAEEYLGLYLKAESEQLKRIFTNLIYNAAEAKKPGQRFVELSIRIQKSQTSDDNITVSFKDNGKGIQNDRLNKIFDKGVSFDKKEGRGGTGLGLYYVKTTLDSWSSTINVSSIINEGTCFELNLKTAFEAKILSLSQLSEINTNSLCIIDDEEHIRKFWQSKFPKIRSYVSPEAYINDPQRSEADYCIIDYHFFNSNMNGIDLIDQMKLHDRSILSTNLIDNPNVYERTLRLGISVLPKPLLNFEKLNLS